MVDVFNQVVARACRREYLAEATGAEGNTLLKQQRLYMLPGHGAYADLNGVCRHVLRAIDEHRDKETRQTRPGVR